jgi:hypothetical protein
MPMNPNSDLVAVSWIGGVPGLVPTQVATVLPQDTATWSELGFITALVVGGNPDLYLPLRNPVFGIDCWAVNPASGKPPWGKANYLAELIRKHVESDPKSRLTQGFYRTLTFTDKGDYSSAQVMEAIMLTEPRRGVTQGMVPMGDEASYARYSFDLQLKWRVV